MSTRQIADTLRGLSMDGVQKANSGHPGMPMGVADFAAVLFMEQLKHNPANPRWVDRDRYVQSAGHGSMLIYSLLHLCGYDLSLDDLKQFRQWESRTPGHPEYGMTPGVETTTGPLGQGIGNAVGMALAEAMLAAKFNRPGHALVDHYTYAVAGDGCMMEGLSHEAASLAGHLGLGKLILFYDSNRITIEGSTDLAYSDDVKKRFQAYNWQVLEIDGHDEDAIRQALKRARGQKKKPTLIIGHTTIAKGSPNKAGTHESHGAPLGDEEIAATKRALGLPEHETFFVPEDIRAAMAVRRAEWARAEAAWNRKFKRYAKAFPELAAEWDRHMNREMPADLEATLPAFDPAKPMATRSASGATLQHLAKAVPHLIGGSADLAPSNNTLLKGYPSVEPGSFGGRNLHFGVREHGMAAVLNGLSLHGGWTVYGATFMVFTDYCRPSIRLSALMHQPVVYVMTHDSIFVGEDGPTHQPVEHLASLRCMPNVTVIRPADPTETATAWIAALENRKGPTILALTRQNLPVIDRVNGPAAAELKKGAYILWENAPNPELILIGTGSETALALEAGKRLAGEGRAVRVVNMPSWELFEKQDPAYRDRVLPPACSRRVAVEAAIRQGWDRYIGDHGVFIGMEGYGASAPAGVLAKRYGFTVDHVAEVARGLLGRA